MSATRTARAGDCVSGDGDDFCSTIFGTNHDACSRGVSESGASDSEGVKHLRSIGWRALSSEMSVDKRPGRLTEAG